MKYPNKMVMKAPEGLMKYINENSMKFYESARRPNEIVRNVNERISLPLPILYEGLQ